MRKSTFLFALLLLVISYAARADVASLQVTESEQPAQTEAEFIQLCEAAELGDANAMFTLAKSYCYGEGVTEDVNIAAEWCLKAAQAGHAEAMYKLGDIYYWGEGVTEDTNEAVAWYIKAADAGYTEAMYELGDMYYYGWGVKEDPNEAEEWYSKAFRSYRESAEAGESDAMQKVASMYENGEGVTKDYTQALQWYNKAAEAGNSDAMYSIGLMYENGKGVNKDYEQAKDWYKKAIELGDNEANMRLVVIFVKKYYKVALWAFLGVLIAGGLIYTTKEKSINAGAKVFEVDSELKEWTMFVFVRRYIGALFIYLIYWLTLWGSITRVFGATLSPDEAKEKVEVGAIESVWDYGWGDHYVWFLVSFCFVAFCCGALAGATAKKKGALVAGIANLPIVVFISLYCWVFYVAAVDVDVESPIAWKIILPLSVVGSVYFAIVGGRVGQETQKTDFEDSTILGIRPLHWFWLWLVSGIYIQCLLSAIIPLWFADVGFRLFYIIPFLFMILPVLAYGYPAVLMVLILTGATLENKNAFVKVLAFVGLYIGGLTAGGIVQLICYKVLHFIF